MITSLAAQPSVLFSRRTRNRNRPQYRPASSQTRLPDWVWGAGLGVIVVIAIGGYFLLSGFGGGGGGAICDSPLAPLGNGTVNQDAFENEEAGLARLVAALQSGDKAASDSLFYGPVHDYMHTVDQPYRQVDVTAAKKLCNEVLNYETLQQNGASLSQILSSIVIIRQDMQDAAVALGYAKPTGVTSTPVPGAGTETPTPSSGGGVTTPHPSTTLWLGGALREVPYAGPA